jgi:hypothetical protein
MTWTTEELLSRIRELEAENNGLRIRLNTESDSCERYLVRLNKLNDQISKIKEFLRQESL